MKWTAEADLVVGLAFVSGKKKLGVGFGIGRRKVIRNIGIDLGEHLLRRCGVFFVKNSSVASLNWSLETHNKVYLDRGKAMKRSNVFNLLLQMMPSSHHGVAPSSPDHWAFLEEVDAPQWADLVKEAALMGTLGDDPWFYRCHMHHETSLARAANLETVVDSHRPSIEVFDRQQQLPTTRKGSHGGGKGGVSKLIKPTLKRNVVKACLGMQRISGGSNVSGRPASRPRRSSSLSRSVKPIKKVNVILRSGAGLLQQQQQQKKAGSDLRVAQSEPSSTVGTPKRSFEGKSGTVRRSTAAVLNVREAAQQLVSREGGGTPGRNNKSVVSLSEIDDTSLNDLSSSSIPLYRLPSPLNQGGGDLSIEMLRLKSSPSATTFWSKASPAQSTSSQESLARGVSSSAAEVAMRKSLNESSRSVKGRRSNVKSSEALDIRSHLPLNGEISEVRIFEPHLEMSAFKGGENANANSTTTTTGVVDWNQQGPNPGVVKRSSLGPPMRVKPIEKVGSSSAKKTTSKVVDSSNNNQDGGASVEKTSVQTTHPILEKLRKSWGSALRVKQRQEAEGALSDARSDSSAEQFSGELKGVNVLSSPTQWEQAHRVQSEIMKPAQPGAAKTTPQPPTEREVLIRNIVTRERRAAINQHQQQQHLQLTTDGIQAPDSPRGSDSSANFATEKTIQTTAEGKTVVAASNAAKAGLAKIQANYQRSKSDLQSKFKKQYVHETMGVNKSLSLQRGNKENMQFEVKVKGQTSPPSGFGWKRKPAVPRRQLSPRQLGTAVNGVRSVPHTPARTNAHALPSLRPTNQTSLHAKGSVNFTKSDTFISSSTRTVGQEAADTSGKSQQVFKGVNNSGILRGSTSSLLKLTKQKSDKIPSQTVKEAITNAVGPKACKGGIQVADESVGLAAEDRKSKTAPQYEPRLHSLKAIKEWEITSGKRYYELPPLERKKANQEITAASKPVVTKKSSTITWQT